MDASALGREIATLETRSESLEWWLSLWIVLVVVGLLVEIYEVVIHHFSGDTRPSKTPWTLFQSLVGPVLIAVGVAGELGMHFIAGKVNTDLRNANKQVVALLNVQAGEARRDAEAAKRDAGTFSARIAEAQRGTAEALRDAATAKKGATEAAAQAKKYEGEIAASKKEAAKALKVAEGERLARVKIEQQLAWRAIPDEQKRRIAARLKPFRGQAFDVVTYSDDGESINLTEDVYRTLLLGEWVLDPKRQWHALMAHIAGFRVVIPAEANPTTIKAGELLAKILNDEALPASLLRAPAADEPKGQLIWVQVGKRR